MIKANNYYTAICLFISVLTILSTVVFKLGERNSTNFLVTTELHTSTAHQSAATGSKLAANACNFIVMQMQMQLIATISSATAKSSLELPRSQRPRHNRYSSRSGWAMISHIHQKQRHQR